MTNRANNTLSIVAFIITLLAIFGMHLTCFDAFNENLWYFYPLAIILFLIQFLLIYFFFRHKIFWVLTLFSIIYLLLLVLKDLYFFLSVYIFNPYPNGLNILCLSLDLMGFCSCFLFRRILHHREK